MNQKILLELNKDLRKQPDPSCNLEKVAELYHFACLVDETIPDIEVPDGATPVAVEQMLSDYLKKRGIYRGSSVYEATVYPDDELAGADLEALEYLDNQIAFDLLISLVSIYSFSSINTIDFTAWAHDYREDELYEDEDELELAQDVLESATEILATKTALELQKFAEISFHDQISNLRRELSLQKREIPAFMEAYISDALDTVEKCTSERFSAMIGGDEGYYSENHSPLYYNVFYLYPEKDRSHENLITDIDASIENDLQEHSGAVELHHDQYKDIQFLMDSVDEYKEVFCNFNYIIGLL